VLRILLFTGLAITLGVLLLTQSRGAFGGMVLAGGLVFFLCLKKKKRKIIIIIVAVALSALLVSTYLSPPGKAGEAAGGVESPVKPGVMSQMKLTAKQAEGTLFFRVIMWNKAMPLIYSNPLMGLGMNEFRYRPDVKYSYSHPHNKLFLLAVELGIPALVAYLAMLICMGYMVYFVWTRKRKEQPWQAAAILGLGIGQLAHFLFEMTDAIPFGAKVDGLSWISLALIAAIYNYTSQDHEERTKEKTKDKPKDKMKANA
ncbi:MAG: O-antigen ligase family protein, partial [bacterium]|nr:O-antigen ligase family protein [bacterium]